MRRYLPFLIVIAAGLAAATSGTILYRAKRAAIGTVAESGQPSGLDRQQSHIRGNPHASVTLEEYGDFECPPCGKLAGVISQIEKDYQPKLRVIFRNYPLPVHPHARDAALAAEAAGAQGKFWEMHDVIYREQSVWSKTPDARALFNAYAGMLGLDLDRFKKDMDSDNVKSRVESDQKQGTAIGVQNTPTIFLNNRAIDPKSLNPDGLRADVEAALKSKSPSS